MVFVVLSNALLGGVVYDSDHMSDTLFILGAAWRSHEGLTPVVDFGYFYGGILEDGLAATIGLLGPDVFAFHYFKIFLTLGLGGAAILILHRCLSPTGLAAVVLIVTVLMLTRFPLEYDFAISRPVSTHSFIYNRFGLAIVMIAGVFVAIPPASRKAELLSGAVLGLLVALTALIKPPFLILAPAAIIGLGLQRRWSALAGILAGILGAVLWFDPDLARWRGALSYLITQVDGDRAASVSHMLLTALRGPFVQPLATLLAITAIAYLLIKRVSVSASVGMLLVAVAGVGMTATMGGSIGQVVLPITIMISLAAAEISHQRELKHAWALRIVTFCMVAALALPHAANLLMVTVYGNLRQDQMLITQGPYARYLALPNSPRTGMQTGQYRMFADGITELNRMGDPSRWGIIADRGISFEYALMSKPVPSYPLWQRTTAPELATGQPLAPEVDIVMLGRYGSAISLRDVLTKKMQQDFLLCKTSEYWEIYIREGSGIAGCD